jgi:hypothetical protein
MFVSFHEPLIVALPVAADGLIERLVIANCLLWNCDLSDAVAF